MTHSNLTNGVHLVGSIPLSTNEEVYYDKVAKESYQRFLQLRAKGVISPKVRFQVSIPTPYECVQGHVRSEFQAQLEPFYERRISDVVESILSAIPAEYLAIQSDSCFMITALEYERGRLPGDFFKPHFFPIHEGILERARRSCALVPSNVPLGWHLCYGDLGHKHFIEPEDLSLLVDVANDLVRCIPGDTDLSWLHMPVPKNRDDTTYFEPLKRLKAGDKTKLYRGLVHPNDEEGTFRRLQAARNVIPGRDFGVSTECGMGRTPKEELASILQISKNVTKAETA
ncbi:uncharacterized protein N7484_007922 [Penicillium longicatenatum]|uniref:uncharacterized protein n=1 Tax=Penicillium longicatenatum TaxID=1561947 RepID=UPI002547D870|nr:uncharacterized protein N7484_007922 [Penicillium longicatenatum]KAJ5640060.1 hypothetical protein N7484_007922 [Penicillium longicatenatum]